MKKHKEEFKKIKKHFLFQLGEFIKMKLFQLIGKVEKKQEKIMRSGK